MVEKDAKSGLKREIRLQIGARLADFYTSRGIKRKAFADSIGFQYDTLRAYEEGRAEPGGDFFAKLIVAYPDADVGYLVTGVRSEPGALQETRHVPVLQDVKAGAPVMGFSDMDVIGTVTTSNTKDKELFALRVRGNSMEPEISENDFVLCAPNRPFISGKIYVVITTDSEATVKQVWRKEDGYELVAFNPEYRNQFLTFEQVIRLIRVVEIRREYE